MRSFALLTCGFLLLAADAQASNRARDPWNIWGAQPPAGTVRATTPLFDASMAPVSLETDQTAAPAKVGFEYSDAYRLRAKIHKYASFATLPLVATELALGQSLYNGDRSKKGAHVAVGTTIGVLFGINTVTGVWNMWEARKDPNGRTRRLAHGLLMMAADVGFLATGATAPGGDFEERRGSFSNFSNSRSTHRTVAITSLCLATAGYMVMLFGR